MTFAVRAFFPGAKSGLLQFAPRFNLAPPVSVRALTANVAIAGKYAEKGGYVGPFGVALSPVLTESPSSFVQSFEGGKLHFTDGQTNATNQQFITISYKGAHCFGSPKFPRSHSGYVIVIVYVENKKDKATIKKFPDDAGGGTYDGWDEGGDQTAGQGVIFGGDRDTQPPSGVIIETLVMGHEPLGSPEDVKKAINDAVEKAKDEAAAAEGVPPDSVPPVVVNVISQGLFAVVDGLFGLTDQVRGRPVARTIKFVDWDTLPPPDSKQFGTISFNWETDIMTDGDASYKAYFNLEKQTIT
jgi:hypothetical protein